MHGLEDLIAQPVLTMEEECQREQSWTDWKGVEYALVEEWNYVNGPARAHEGCTPGIRDELNDGKQPGHFLKSINGRIDERRKEAIMANRLEGVLPEVSERVVNTSAYILRTSMTLVGCFGPLLCVPGFEFGLPVACLPDGGRGDRHPAVLRASLPAHQHLPPADCKPHRRVPVRTLIDLDDLLTLL